MAARRAKPKSRTRNKYKSVFSLKNFIFSYAHLALITGAFLKTSPLTFALGGYVPGFSTSGKVLGIPGSKSGTAITLKEIVDGVQSATGEDSPLMVIGENVRVSFVPYLVSSIGLTLLERVLTKSGVWTRANRAVRSIPGLGTMVKF